MVEGVSRFCPDNQHFRRPAPLPGFRRKAGRMRVALLGPLRAVNDDGTPIDIGGARLRMLLARLALDAGRAVPADALVDGLGVANRPPTPPTPCSRWFRGCAKPCRWRSSPGPAATGSPWPAKTSTPSDFDGRRRRPPRAGRGPERPRGRAGPTTPSHCCRAARSPTSSIAPFAPAPARRLTELRAEAGRRPLRRLDPAGRARRRPRRPRRRGRRRPAARTAGRAADPRALRRRAAVGGAGRLLLGIRRTLADQLGVDPSAELQEIHLAALRGEFAPPSPVTDRLPTRLTTFIGRDYQLKLLAELLGSARLPPATGPGGAGKTRLSTEAASRHPAHQQGRVWFAALAGVRDPDDLGGALLGALEIRDIRSTDTEIRRTAGAGRAGPRGARRRGSAAGAVWTTASTSSTPPHRLADELLQRAPRLRILADGSREPLADHRGGPLPARPRCRCPRSAPRPRRPPSSTSTPAVPRPRGAPSAPTSCSTSPLWTTSARSAACSTGMPLALELAAARLRSMTGGADRRPARRPVPAAHLGQPHGAAAAADAARGRRVELGPADRRRAGAGPAARGVRRRRRAGDGRGRLRGRAAARGRRPVRARQPGREVHCGHRGRRSRRAAVPDAGDAARVRAPSGWSSRPSTTGRAGRMASYYADLAPGMEPMLRTRRAAAGDRRVTRPRATT